MLNLSEALNFAVATVQAAGELLRDHYRNGVTVKYKGEIDLITEADHASEALILDRIRSAYPACAILSEESGASANSSPYVWIADPLDGTTNFAHGLPIFSVTLALVVDGVIEVGVTYNPIYDELYTARRGQGAYLNGGRLHVSVVPTLDKSLLVTGFPYDRRTNPNNNIRQFTDFSLRAQGVLRLGSAALDLSAVAAGRLDGYWEFKIFSSRYYATLGDAGKRADQSGNGSPSQPGVTRGWGIWMVERSDTEPKAFLRFSIFLVCLAHLN